MPPPPSCSSCWRQIWRAPRRSLPPSGRRTTAPRPRSTRCGLSSRACAMLAQATPAEGSVPSRRPGSGIRPTRRPAPSDTARGGTTWPWPDSSGWLTLASSRACARRHSMRSPLSRTKPSESGSELTTHAVASASAAGGVRRDPRRADQPGPAPLEHPSRAARPACSVSAARPGVDEDRAPLRRRAVEVRAGEDRWRGAAERVLRGFALSLIVGDDDYARVAGWVDGHHLGARLVYHRVRVGERHVSRPTRARHLGREARAQPGPVCRLAGAPSSPPGPRTSASRASRTSGALTPCRDRAWPGQVGQPSREGRPACASTTGPTYVLGWDNKAKQDALIERGARVQEQLDAVDDATPRPPRLGDA